MASGFLKLVFIVVGDWKEAMVVVCVFLVMQLLLLAVVFWLWADAWQFLKAHPEISDRESFVAFKKVVRRNMYGALAVPFLLAFAAGAAVWLVETFGALALLLVMGASIPMVVLFFRFKSLDGQVRNLPCVDPELLDEHGWVVEMWGCSVLPRFEPVPAQAHSWDEWESETPGCFSFALGGMLGAVAGGLFGLFGLIWFVQTIDWMTGATGGDALMTIGWIFCFYTVPLGALFGCFLGTRVGGVLAVRLNRREQRWKAGKGGKDQTQQIL